MTTVLEYREYGKQCMEGAQTATTDTLRKQFLDLAKIWMMEADKMDAYAPLLAEPKRLNGSSPLAERGAGPNEPG